MTMNRRLALMAPLAPLTSALPAWAQASAAGAAGSEVLHIATAWRVPGTAAPDAGDRIGVLLVDWNEGRVQPLWSAPVPSRAHGLLALPGGDFLVVANRPGRWLQRCSADGAAQQRLAMDSEKPARTLNGHVEASADGAWLYTTETDPLTGAGWVSVRHPQTLARVAQYSAHGIDPHQLLRGPGKLSGTLMVAVGGIVRDTLGRKLDEPMAPALVQLEANTGAVLGRWTLPDTQLSLRHIAWAQSEAPRLGVGLQAEHARPEERLAAPVLAVWQAAPGGGQLALAGTSAAAVAQSGGYAGDIAAGPAGGFVLSAQKQGRALWWHPGEPEAYTTIAQVTEPCGLLPLPDGRGVALSAGRGLARWHTQTAPRMLPWHAALAPDNHWVALDLG
jgi:uncharacterized protein